MIKVILLSYEDWAKEIVSMMKRYPLVRNKWKTSRFKKMHHDDLSPQEAFRCWFCAH